MTLGEVFIKYICVEREETKTLNVKGAQNK
jgi:hypothetical protein